MSGFDWQKIVVDSIPSVLSGLIIALIVYGLDERRAKRDRRLSDFRIASNWEVSSPKPSMRNFHLSGENLSGYDLSNANLENADLSKAGLWATNLSRANLRGTDFRGAELVGTILKGAVAIHAKFSRAVVRPHKYPDLDQNPDFSNASFIACDFQNARLEEVIFLGANFGRADFSGATLVKCDFTGADLSESKWRKVRRVENCTWKKVKGISPDNFPLELLKEIEKQNAKRG